MENVIVMCFAGTEQAEEGLRGLRQLHEAHDVQLDAAAVVDRAAAGPVVVGEVAEEFHLRATAAAGLVGTLIGALAGPPGAIIGGVTGAAIGSLVDVADAESADQILQIFGETVPPGSAATIAVLSEKSEAAVDGLAADLGGTVMRRPRAEVEHEIVRAEEAVIDARRDDEGGRTVGERLREVKDAVLDRR
ncbi:MAG TPA: DUF1269 domain-containing protein [Acidimicrobiales bacterium]|jgi:uncharacterized membrane protein|nr:DUF1269 domain-containing protein [Acidimicrobiales bacterium]